MSATLLDFPTRERMDHTMRVRFPDELVDVVQRRAEAEGMTPSQIVRRAVERDLGIRGRPVDDLASALRNIVGTKDPSA